MKIIPYIPADAIILSRDRTKTDAANFNQVAGPGFSLFEGKELLGCGGLRISGIAEAWCMFSEAARKNHKKIILKAAKIKIEEMQREHEIVRLYAESEVSENFLEHLGFKKQEIFVR